MRRLRFVLLVVGIILFAAAADAATRTFVSAASGSDANPCSRALPCRTFAFALTMTDANGEIDTLDPGGYGPVTINKAVSIVSGLGEAGVLVPASGNGITVAAANTDMVSLRGLVIEGAGVGSTGILFSSGRNLTVTNCVIRNFSGDSIDFFPSSYTLAMLSVSDTLLTANVWDGINVMPSGGTTKVVLDRVRIVNNGTDGFIIDGQYGGLVRLTATDCVISNNGRDGAGGASYNVAATEEMTLTHCTISNNVGTAVTGSGGGTITIRVGDCTVTDNGSTYYAGTGTTVSSYGDNYINGNGDGDPSPPVISKK